MSPWRTTTAPAACLAILPVSNEISLPAISTETVVRSGVHCSYGASLLTRALRSAGAGGLASFGIRTRSMIAQAPRRRSRMRERRRRRSSASPWHRPARLADVALHPLGDARRERRSASKRSTSRPRSRQRAHRCGSSSPALVGVERVVQLPRTRPGAPPPRRRAPARARARMLGPQREVAEGDAQRRVAQARRAPARSAGRRSRRRRARAARRRARGRGRRRAAGGRGGREVAGHAAEAASPSKMRFTPGRSPGCRPGGSSARRASGADDDQRAVGEAGRLEVGAEGARRRALGLEVRQLLDLHAERLAERRCDHDWSQETP